MFSSLIDAKKLKLKIDRIVVGKQNRAVIWPKDNEQIDKINKEIQLKGITQFIVRKPKDQLYKIRIDGVQLEKKKDYKSLNQSIVEMNEELGATAEDLNHFLLL